MTRLVPLIAALTTAALPASSPAQSHTALVFADQGFAACDITADTPGIYEAYLFYDGPGVTDLHFQYYLLSSPGVSAFVEATHGSTWSGGGACSSGCTFVNLYGCAAWPGGPSLVATLHLDLTAGVPDCGEFILLGPEDYTGSPAGYSLEVAGCDGETFAPANLLTIHKTGIPCTCEEEPVATETSTWGKVKALYR